MVRNWSENIWKTLHYTGMIALGMLLLNNHASGLLSTALYCKILSSTCFPLQNHVACHILSVWNKLLRTRNYWLWNNFRLHGWEIDKFRFDCGRSRVEGTGGHYKERERNNGSIHFWPSCLSSGSLWSRVVISSELKLLIVNSCELCDKTSLIVKW